MFNVSQNIHSLTHICTSPSRAANTYYLGWLNFILSHIWLSAVNQHSIGDLHALEMNNKRPIGSRRDVHTVRLGSWYGDDVFIYGDMWEHQKGTEEAMERRTVKWLFINCFAYLCVCNNIMWMLVRVVGVSSIGSRLVSSRICSLHGTVIRCLYCWCVPVVAEDGGPGQLTLDVFHMGLFSFGLLKLE